METNYMGGIQSSGSVEMLGAHLIQKGLERRKLRDSPGLKGWEGGRVRRLMEELWS